MKAIHAIDCLIKNNDTAAQERMGIIYGETTNTTADVTNHFGARTSISWGNVIGRIDYLYCYLKPLDTSMVKDADGDEYDAELLDQNDQRIHLYKLN